jgi:hypothetical protein
LTGLVVVVLAVLTVLGTSVLKDVEWSAKTKNLLALGLSVLAGGAYVLQQEGWDVSAFASTDLLEVVTLVYGAQQAVYNFVFNGTRFNAKLESVGVGSGKADDNDELQGK